jgi:S1-C subfamily serine protease
MPVRGRNVVMFLRVFSVLVVGFVLVSCAGRDLDERAVSLSVVGCGDAFDSRVAGVVVDRDLVLTVAHAMLQADEVEVDADGVGRRGHVVAVDRRTDLALVAVEGLGGDRVSLGSVDRGERVLFRSGLTSGDFDGEVAAIVDLRIEEALGTERVVRSGLELRAAGSVGDSGAGVYTEDGELVGLVFAVNDDGSDTVWATSATEITALIDGPKTDWVCDPTRSRVVAGNQP